jgi:hypothetical protein
MDSWLRTVAALHRRLLIVNARALWIAGNQRSGQEISIPERVITTGVHLYA